MTTLRCDAHAPDPDALARAARLLREGQLVAFPTETVYGLGANALDPAAIARIYEAKGRPAYNPLIVHVPDVSAARRLTREWPTTATILAERWWPGPLTLVLPKSSQVPDAVTAGLDTVALRVPGHPVAQALLRAAGVPLAAPSANRSGGVSPTTAAHVERSLANRVPLILDGGPTDLGLESTVVDLTGSVPVLLRPGAISVEELEALIGPLALPAPAQGPDSPRLSPGMLDRHYAPSGRVMLYASLDDTSMLRAIADTRREGGRVGAIAYHALPVGAVTLIGLPADTHGYARGIYDALHTLDEAGCALILVEEPPSTPEWLAVRDRLRRAAT